MDNLLNIAMALWFLFMGIVCIYKTQSLQAFLMNFFNSIPAARAWEGFFKWTQTPRFVTIAKILGVLSMLNFFMLMYVIMYGEPGVATF